MIDYDLYIPYREHLKSLIIACYKQVIQLQKIKIEGSSKETHSEDAEIDYKKNLIVKWKTEKQILEENELKGQIDLNSESDLRFNELVDEADQLLEELEKNQLDSTATNQSDIVVKLDQMQQKLEEYENMFLAEIVAEKSKRPHRTVEEISKSIDLIMDTNEVSKNIYELKIQMLSASAEEKEKLGQELTSLTEKFEVLKVKYASLNNPPE